MVIATIILLALYRPIKWDCIVVPSNSIVTNGFAVTISINKNEFLQQFLIVKLYLVL